MFGVEGRKEMRAMKRRERKRWKRERGEVSFSLISLSFFSALCCSIPSSFLLMSFIYVGGHK